MRRGLQAESDCVQDRYDNLYLSLKNKNDIGKVVVLVEGPDDVEAYGNVFDVNKVVLNGESVCEGCSKVMELAKKLNEKPFFIKNQIILFFAIRDADFLRLNNSITTFNNLFYTDCHDLEMMILKLPGVIQTLLSTLDCEVNNIVLFVEDIIEELLILSKFKLYNSYFSLGCNFSHLDLMSSDLELRNLCKLYNCVIVQSKNAIASIENVKYFVENHIVDDNYELITGHDFVTMICKKIRLLYHKQFSEKKMSSVLYSQLTPKRFRHTNLFYSIREWQQKNNSIVLL